MRENKVKRSKSEKILVYVLVALLSIHSLTLLYPFLWMLMNSFKTANGFVKDIWGLPVSWQFQNWIDAFELTIPNVNVTFAGMYLNTLFFVVVNVSLNMFFNAISAYVVAKYEFKAMKVISLSYRCSDRLPRFINFSLTSSSTILMRELY